MQEREERRSRDGGCLLVVHLESLGIDHRDARSRGIPVSPAATPGDSLRAAGDRVPRPVKGSLL
jgi:hypothetical protein